MASIPAFNWNDPYAVFNQVSSADLAQMTPEQRAQFAQTHIDSSAGSRGERSGQDAYNQWLAWDDKFDPSCPSRTPYRGRAGQCAEKPDDCPPGTTLHGNDCVSPDQLPAWAGGSGGGAPQSTTPQSQFSSPLAEMLKNQGSFLSQHDPTRGDNQAGIRGGIVKGGGIWWQPNQQRAQTGGVDPAPAAPAASPLRGAVDPRYGGIMGGQSMPASARPGRPDVTQSPVTGGIMGGQNIPRMDGLTTMMSGVQGQGGFNSFGRPSMLGGLLSPYQRKPLGTLGVGNWFGG